MPPEGTVYRVEQAMNDQRAMRLEAVEGGATVHAVQYATPRVRRRLASLSAGDIARLRVTRVGRRANVWCVERTYPGPKTRRRTDAETERGSLPDDAEDEPRVSPPDAV